MDNTGMIPETTLRRLRKRMKERNLSYARLAVEAGCTESYVRQLLNGQKEPPQWKTIVWDRIVETIGDGDGR